VAIVIGGNSGIGQVIVCHREATEALEREVVKLGDQSGVETDVSKIAGLQILINNAVSRFGRVDITSLAT